MDKTKQAKAAPKSPASDFEALVVAIGVAQLAREWKFNGRPTPAAIQHDVVALREMAAIAWKALGSRPQ